MPCLDRPTFGHTGSGHSQRLTHHSQTINSLYKARATFLHEEVARLRRLGRHRLFYIFAVQPTRRLGESDRNVLGQETEYFTLKVGYGSSVYGSQTLCPWAISWSINPARRRGRLHQRYEARPQVGG